MDNGQTLAHTSPQLKVVIECGNLRRCLLRLIRIHESSVNAEYLFVVLCVRERLAVRKQAAQKFEGERFNLRKVKELEVKEKYQIEITNRFAALENLMLTRM